MNTYKRVVASILVLAMIITLLPVNTGKAKADEIKLIQEEDADDYHVTVNPNQITVISGDQLDLTKLVTNDLPEGCVPSYSYEIIRETPSEVNGDLNDYYYYSQNIKVLNKVDGKDGWFLACNAGTATVRVTLTQNQVTNAYGDTVERPYQWTSECTITVIPYAQRRLKMGETFSLDYKKNSRYKDCTYEMDSYASTRVVVDANGVVTCIGEGVVQIFLRSPDTKERVMVAMLTCYEPTIMELQDFQLTVGMPAHMLSLTDIDGRGVLEWSSNNPAVASVDSNGAVTAVSEGVATITVNWRTLDGTLLYTGSCVANITNPHLTKAACNIGIQKSVYWISGITTTEDTSLLTVPLAGVGSYSQITYSSSNSDVVSVNEYGSLTPYKKGTSVITIVADGITLYYTVRVTKPNIKTTSFMLTKGKKATVKLTGTNSYSKAVYQSMNKKIATVSKTGKMKGKKYGSALVSCQVDGITIYVTVAVGKAKLIRAVKAARKVLGSRYSQAKRMQKGYYDCSSLVWRTFRQVGLYFGSKSYAPTAAAIGQYMAGKKWVISKKAVPYTKLQPGDILFFSSGKNGRYRNITHVGIYSGNLTMIHANGSVVDEVSYYERMDTVLVARPYK